MLIVLYVIYYSECFTNVPNVIPTFHYSKEFDHALHWHRLYLQHGRPQSGFIFEMRKITRSIYHKKVKQIDSNQKRIKKTRIAKGFLENRSRDFWSEISKIRRKTHITPCTVEGFSNNEDISSCFSSYYKDLYNSVSFDSIEWSKLLTIRSVMNVLIILLMMSKMPLTN